MFNGLNRAAKVMVYILIFLVIGYLMFFSVLLALLANDMETCTPYEMFFGIMPFILVVDFFVRFISQQTPAQRTKPYSLLPIPKYTCIELFILSSLMSPNNLVWLALTVPYSIMTLLFSEGLVASVGLIVSFQILIAINSLWYMFVRTLINQSIKWWILPIAFYALLFSPLYFNHFDWLFDSFAFIGTGFTFWNPISYVCLLLVVCLWFEVNKRMQFHFIYNENASEDNVKLRKVSEFRMFDRYGEVGEYLKLEVKSLMRNKNIRKNFIFAMALAVFYSLAIAFTDVYDSSFMQILTEYFSFILFGAMMLQKIMCAEGNYIDGLMVHKENICSLLKAKYYFCLSFLVIPFILLLPSVFIGKSSLLMLLSLACFTAGPAYCLFMQMAVYNCQTMPLNTKLTTKGSIEVNYFQMVSSLFVIFFPEVFLLLMQGIFGENTAYAILLIIGLLFVFFHSVWIKNIYKRFMQRRYKNMESFRSSR